MTQCERVLKYMEDFGSINPMQAMKDLGVMRLGDRGEGGAGMSEWISVKDKLPEDDQEVILCTRETETYGKHREKKKIYKNIYIGYFDGYEWLTSYCHGCEYIFRMNEKYPNETIEVTHWMPLPSTEGLK